METIDISLIRMLSEGPEVSLNGSPTVALLAVFVTAAAHMCVHGHTFHVFRDRSRPHLHGYLCRSPAYPGLDRAEEQSTPTFGKKKTKKTCWRSQISLFHIVLSFSLRIQLLITRPLTAAAGGCNNDLPPGRDIIVVPICRNIRNLLPLTYLERSLTI